MATNGKSGVTNTGRAVPKKRGIDALPLGLHSVVRGLVKAKPTEYRRRVVWVAKCGTDVLSKIPADLLPATIEHLVMRNGWIFRISGCMAGRALARDLDIVKKHLCKPLDVKEFHAVLLDVALPAPDRHDRMLIGWAIVMQLLGVIVLFVLHNRLGEREHVLEWILLDQALALLLSAALVGECKHVDGRRWGRFTSAATLFNLSVTATVIFIS